MSAAAGRLRDIRRYPVSAMGGETLKSAQLDQSGVAGDRLYGLYASETNEVASPGRQRHWRPLPNALARLYGDAVEISVDQAHWLREPEAARRLGDYLGFAVELRPYHGNGNAVPLYERAPIHLITTASMRHLSSIIPSSIIDARQFRPNLVIEVDDALGPIEQSWMGRAMRIGDAVLKVAEPCVRCAFVSLAQEPGLPFDKNVSGAISQRLDGNLGILCSIVEPGRVSVGDAVAVEA